MDRFEPTLENSQFLSDLRKHVRANPNLYQAAGDWLDQEFSAEACWHKEIEWAEQDNQEFPPPQYPETKPRERRIVETKLNRIVTAVKHFLNDDTALVTALRWKHASRLLLLCWILTDETAHEFAPKLCDLQDWGWDDDDGSDQQFTRLWSQAVLPKPDDWRKWLDLSRRVWVARPDTGADDPSQVLIHVADALERFAFKVGVCLNPDNPQWASEPAAKGVLMNIRRWQSDPEESRGLPPHLIAGKTLKIEIAHQLDLVLDRLPHLAPRFHDDFNGLWIGLDRLTDEFNQGPDSYDASLGKMLSVALRVEKLADRVRKATEQLQKITSKTPEMDARNTVHTKRKKTTPEEAKQWAETYIKNHSFPGLNVLAGLCAAARNTTCSPHTMRKAINSSESLQKAEAVYKLQAGKPGPKPQSPDDPAWVTMVDEALRILLECAPESERHQLDAEQLRHDLAKNTSDELAALVKDAQEQAERRRKAVAHT